MTSASRPTFPFTLLGFWLRRILPVWGLIALMIFLVQIAVCGIVCDNKGIKALLNFLDLLPSFIKTALGGEALQVGNTSALIAIGYQHPLVLLLFMLFAVGVPTGLLTGEVEKGTMELILSRSITKTQVYVCAGALTVAGMFALVLVMFFGTFTATRIYHFEEPVSLHPFFRAAINGGLLASAAGAIALLAAAGFRRRSTAVGITTAYLVVNYFVAVIAEWWPRMRFLKPATLFQYVNGPKIFREPAWPVGDMCVLAAILIGAAIAGGVIWHRRDLPL